MKQSIVCPSKNLRGKEMPLIIRAAELAAESLEHLAPGAVESGLNLLKIAMEKSGLQSASVRDLNTVIRSAEDEFRQLSGSSYLPGNLANTLSIGLKREYGLDLRVLHEADIREWRAAYRSSDYGAVSTVRPITWRAPIAENLTARLDKDGSVMLHGTAPGSRLYLSQNIGEYDRYGGLARTIERLPDGSLQFKNTGGVFTDTPYHQTKGAQFARYSIRANGDRVIKSASKGADGQTLHPLFGGSDEPDSVVSMRYRLFDPKQPELGIKTQVNGYSLTRLGSVEHRGIQVDDVLLAKYESVFTDPEVVEHGFWAGTVDVIKARTPEFSPAWRQFHVKDRWIREQL
jgi:hypothetical protein